MNWLLFTFSSREKRERKLSANLVYFSRTIIIIFVFFFNFILNWVFCSNYYYYYYYYYKCVSKEEEKEIFSIYFWHPWNESQHLVRFPLCEGDRQAKRIHSFVPRKLFSLVLVQFYFSSFFLPKLGALYTLQTCTHKQTGNIGDDVC